MRIEQLRREFDLEVRWSLFPLHPDTPPDGVSLDELFAGKLDVGAMLDRLSRIAAELGLPFGPRTHTYNSRRAQELGKWADEKGQGEAFHQAVYRAYFADGKNIAKPDVLAEIAANLYLDPGEALQVIADRRYVAAVDADWQRAGNQGVTAVPTVVCNRRQLVGFQPYESFREFILGA